jgi:hypothetical protein
MLAALNGGEGGLFQTATTDGFGGLLGGSVSAATLLFVAVLVGGLFGGTDIVAPALERRASVVRATKAAKFGVALVHAAIHLAIVVLVLCAIINLVGDHPLWIWVLALPVLAMAGAALGATVFGATLLAVHRVRGVKAWEAANMVFTGQSIADYKNLLRMRLHRDGSLTIYPLGVERACRTWRHAGPDGAKPRIVPSGAPPVAHAIDVPLRFDASGRRVS